MKFGRVRCGRRAGSFENTMKLCNFTLTGLLLQKFNKLQPSAVTKTVNIEECSTNFQNILHHTLASRQRQSFWTRFIIISCSVRACRQVGTLPQYVCWYQYTIQLLSMQRACISRGNGIRSVCWHAGAASAPKGRRAGRSPPARILNGTFTPNCRRLTSHDRQFRYPS